MTVYNPDHPDALVSRLTNPVTDLLVVCYCAAWCDTCRSYQEDFDAVAAQWPDHPFIWIDIEEHPELLGDEDVENFPTILLQNRRGNVFFGEQLPYRGHLDRLIKEFEASGQTFADGPPSLYEALAA